MSGVEVEFCDIKSIDRNLDPKKGLKLETNSNAIALEVLNDIVENALDSAISNEEQSLRNFRMVGDIVDQYTPRAAKITDFNDITPVLKSHHLTTTEEEVKKLIEEITSSPSPSSKGTGDQLQENEEIVTKKKPIGGKNFTIEKKSRLTDLVRTSKSVISKLLSNENTKTKETEWEEQNEKFVKSIELNRLNSEKKISSSKSNENLLPLVVSDSGNMIKFPDESEMENVNLKCSKEKGTDAEDPDYSQKSMTFPIASCSKMSAMNQDSNENLKDKKKWNLGSKLVNFIKKKASRKDITKTDA